MYKLFFCLLVINLLTGCTQQQVDKQQDILIEYNHLKSQYESLEKEYNDLKEVHEKLEKNYHDLNNSLNDSIYPINESEYFSLYSKREYSEKIKYEGYINKPDFIYNGIQKLTLKLDSTDALKVNEQLNENENNALHIYKLNEENYLKEACFLSYDIKETEEILSITSNLYTYLLDAGRPGILYDAYNFDVNTGKRLNNEQFFQYLSINPDTLCEVLNSYFTQKAFQKDDLLIDKTDNHMGITFSLIDESLIITYSANASEQYVIEEYGKIAIPLSEIIN